MLIDLARVARFEWTLLRSRRLVQGAAIAMVALGAAGAAWSGSEGQGAWGPFAEAAQFIALMSLLLGGILGATSFGSEHATGAFRMLLLRPISRSTLWLGRALVLVAVHTTLTALGLFAAWLTLRFGSTEFGDITRLGALLLDAEEMRRLAPPLLFTQLIAGIIAPLIGILCATLLRDVASTLALALPILLGPGLCSLLGLDVGANWATLYAWDAPQQLRALSEGITLQADHIEDGSYLATALPVIGVWIVATIGIALAAMQRQQER